MLLHKTEADFAKNCKVKTFPDGSREILLCSRPIFGGAGWESSEKSWALPLASAPGGKLPAAGLDKLAGPGVDAAAPAALNPDPAHIDRAMRRARSKLRDIALCTDFRYFVTLTLDKSKVNRYDIREVTRKLNNWLDNAVRRRGLAYVLVPEHHKDGAIHFHGFFNGALPVTDSGTLSGAGGVQRPRRPRSAAERSEWLAAGAHPVYNLPAWPLGYSTALELYGEREKAVAYVCKYIGKDFSTNGGKIGGRWYYSGGAIRRPEVTYHEVDFSFDDLAGAYEFSIPEMGARFALLRVPAAAPDGI